MVVRGLFHTTRRLRSVMIALICLALLVPAFTNIYADTAPTGGVAYWKFDEGSGTSAADSWGTNTGTVNGATWTTVGKVGAGLVFNGSSNYVNVGKTDIAGAWTAAMWVNRTDNTAASSSLMSSANYALKLEQYNHTNKVGFSKYGVADYAFNYSAPTGTWVHLTFVGTSTGTTLYVNGTLQETNSAIISLPMDKIGVEKGGTTGFLKGSLDDLQIYNRALSAAEIFAIANPGGGNGQLSRTSRLFIEKGLQVQAWVATDPKAENGTLDDVQIYNRALTSSEIQNLASAGTSPQTGRVANWNFNEGSGTNVGDSWGNNAGTVDSAAWTASGKSGSGLLLNGNKFVHVGKPDLSGAWTAAMWVNRKNSTDTYSDLLNSSGSSLRLEQWNDTNKVGFTKIGVADYTFNYIVPEAAWVHLTFVGTNTGTSLYVNGVFQESNAAVINLPLSKIGSTSSLAARRFPTAQEWSDIHFTAPTYYEAPMYNQTFYNALPNSQWSLAKVPYANQLNAGPPSSDHFLSPQQRANVSNLVSMQFGDEEGYSTQMVQYLKDWFGLSRNLYPNVLVHNNQGTLWSETQYRNYIQTAQPDLITYDDYYFYESGSDVNITSSITQKTAFLRKMSLEGYDGTGQQPIAFGQYLLGYKTGSNPWASGNYIPTESQLNLVPFLTLTLGGKWLSVFRWEYDPSVFLFIDSQGNPTPQYAQYAEMARQARNIGQHLMRLSSSDVQFVPGQHKSGSSNVLNSMPSYVSSFTAKPDYYIQNASAVNLGTQNDGLPGDVIIGYFKKLPGVDPSTMPTSTAKYFMVQNGLATGNGKVQSQQHGSLNETSQKITLTFDLGSRNPNTLKRVSRTTGNTEAVTLTPVSGTVYKLEITLGGGMADLFYWE
ncbi:hypothetical protein GCM10008018_43260 [Paenibacillus marchantiophytorum]|uniref:LamG-like jellyroll fold domain-containing protein n=1 Tax=Paenibacillus marchantiophytorum TaxID=1619310 RepID=A0ABQ1EYM7_9BACL|nr:LamG domain-containing protein [Paenibacillus marchantiophytorum]GFZ92305.1 hypothetical protein GCM10008018_43260 [Paenibacillus marchantiophytorum]